MNTETPSPGSAFRDDDEVTLFMWEGMLWSRCVTRKPMRDHDGGDDIPGGSVAWRPLTNNGKRMNRLAYVPSRAEIVSRTQNAKLSGTGKHFGGHCQEHGFMAIIRHPLFQTVPRRRGVVE